MAQQQWTVPGYGGVPYKVGLYHGVQSGHLLVQCNGKILIIDFGVTKNKDYSFLLGEELYELEIIKTATGYEYVFKHNEEIETPHNVRRNKTEKTDKRRIRAAVIVLLVLILSIVGTRAYWSNLETNIRQRLAKGEGVLTQARLLKDGYQWKIIYKIDGDLIQKQLLKEDEISIFGFTNVSGDRYQIRVFKKYKYIYFIDWTTADQKTRRRFFTQCYDLHQRLHPALSSEQVHCQLKAIYELEELAGLAKIYNQNNDDWPIYNENSYQELIKRDSYENKLEECL